ncbi:MAG: GNAT family N-acetyltransferase [Eubacteriales bacterium]
MHFSEAALEDLDMLIQIRIDFLRYDGGFMSTDMENTLRTQLAVYIPKHLNRDLFIFTAKDNRRIISTVFLSMTEKIPNTEYPNGITGIVHNVYTYPAYRKAGMATALLQEMVKQARFLDISAVDLIATDEGRPLYEKAGFRAIKNTYMRLSLIAAAPSLLNI